ncbi:TldD/PmbA family protein [Patescibacteria group bacterium]|nr:TldD/PmbA family protein [Patescibacteria group bacterium]
MYGKKKLNLLAELILGSSKAKETEALVWADQLGLTRFANNQIHQNVVRDSIHYSVRCVIEKKIGVAGGDDISRKGLMETVWGASELAKAQQPDPDFPGLPGKGEYKKIKAFDQPTADCSPQQRAQQVKRVINVAKSAKTIAFGAFSTGVTETLVANSKGVRAYFPSTRADFSTTMMVGDGSGYGSSLAQSVAGLEIKAEVNRAVETALKSRQPKRLEPGEYEVVLAPAAVNEMLIYLSYLAFGGRAYHEKRSFVSGQLGKKVLSEKITLWDDGLDESGLPLPFDYEGVARKKLSLIEKGVAKKVVYDSYLAAKYKTKSTGHGLPAPNTLDALATHLHLKPAVSVKNQVAGEHGEELLEGVKKGLYISRFWYVNCHHHKSLTITGLTRDGTFLIENGELSRPVMNLRFTQSIVEALNQVVAVGRRARLVESWAGANSVPALRIKRFRFTGVSDLG